MKIAIAHVQAPFITGGAEYLSETLADRLAKRGHTVALVRIPFNFHSPARIAEHLMAFRLVDLQSQGADLLVASKFPGYVIAHPNKRLWLAHQFRQAYELWGTIHAAMPETPLTAGTREMIQRADRQWLGESRRVHPISRVVANRLAWGCGILSDDVLYTPLDQPEIYSCGAWDNYVFYPSRMCELKRQHLAIQAMTHVRSSVRLLLAGQADTDDYFHRLQALIAAHDLAGRVELLGRVSEARKCQLMADARAVLYLPFDEDGAGYVTLEACASAKPVVTLTDAGGPNELITDGLNGLVADPTPQSLAAAIDRLAGDRDLAVALGRAAAEVPHRYGISWDSVLDRLTEPVD